MSGVYGADVSTPVSAEQWQTLMTQNAVTFGVVRCYESGGSVDPNAATTINQGWAAGLSNIAVYHFPCLTVGAAAQVQAAVQALSAANASFGVYWIDVEQGAGWSTTDFASNAAFLTQMIQAAEALGLTVGIYTSPYEWSLTINNNDFASYPLWYAEYDGQTSFCDFTPFGGWTAPAMKQFVGDQSNAGVGFDGNWAPAFVSPAPACAPGSAPAPAQTSAQASAVRGNVTTYATSIAGLSAPSNYASYVSVIAPGETITTQQSMATTSSCGLAVAGIWRACGYYGPTLNAPYVVGSALSRLMDIGQAAGGYMPYTQGMLPNPGDMVFLGTEEHVYTVISVVDQGNGNAVIQSVDGGQPSDASSSVPGAGCDAILACQHTWSGGQDTDAYYTRPIVAIINVTTVLTSAQMPLAGFVEAAPPGALGADCIAAISSEVASAISSGSYAFCIRYVSPNETTVTALTLAEAQGILGAGLGLMLTQRIDASALALSAALGTQHGTAAAQSATSVGLPMCVNVWLLLDNIPSGTSATGLVSYYNAWYAAAYGAGFVPGLCVGPTEVLNATQLGDLAFCNYWQAAGVTVSPSPRGYQLVEGGPVTVGGVQMTTVTAQNDAGVGSPQGPGQAQWLIASP